MRCAFCLLLLLFHCHYLVVAALAQGTTATLSGTVTDQNGAVIPDASIAVINIARGFQRTGTTNDHGTFVVPLLPPGNYTVKAEHTGFTPAEVRDVVLNVNDQVAMKIRMSVGTFSQTVQIVEGSPLINESTGVATVVDRQFVANLPLNGRSFQSLITLTPGVVITGPKISGNTGQFSVNGQRTNANYFTIDGVSANIAASASQNPSQLLGGSLPGVTASGGMNNLVSIDALQEFKVLTSSYAAEFGRTPGGQISIVTRSGTNDFHGTLFEYFRNDVLDANDWFANRGGLKKPPLRQNDFGGVVGGPVLFPRFGDGGQQPWYNGRNRTFFFFSYEGLRLRQPQVASNAEVPSISLRQSALPQVQPFLNAFPVPNGPELSNGLAFFSAGYSIPSTLDATSIRIDHTINSRVNFFARFNEAPSSTVPRSSTRLSSPSPVEIDARTLTTGITFAVTPQVINEFRANYSRVTGENFSVLDNFGGAVPVPVSQIFPTFAPVAHSQFAFTLAFSTFPEIRIGLNSANRQRQINLVDSLSLIHGAHTVKFGFDYRRLSPIFLPTEYFQNPFFLSAAAVRAATASIVQVLAQRASHPLFMNFSAFAQDTWKATPRLTLSYGLRWEVNPGPIGANGDDALTATGLDNLATAVVAPKGTPLYKTRYNNFAPRFGLAYQVSQAPGKETILRGGIGIFYDLGTGQTGQAFGSSAPFIGGAKNTFNAPFPLVGTVAEPNPIDSKPFRITAFDPSLTLPRTYQWNIAVEQSLGTNQTISASYIGALGRQLNNFEQHPISGNPEINTIRFIGNKATSDYHAMQLQFQRRLFRGLQALASYTWSHSIDKVSSDIGFGLDRGSSDFDVRHAFSAAITYNVPAPSPHKLVGALLSNWSIDSIIHAQSATPVDLLASSSVNLAGQITNIRPDLIAGIPLYLNDPKAPGGRRFNNTVDPSRPGCKGPFCIPPTTRQGTLGRNVLRAFPLNQVDLTLRRQFSLTERVKLQFRSDFFNIFNHPNFGDPNGTLTSGTFGEATTVFGKSLGSGGIGGGFSTLYQIGGPRSTQISMKLQF